MRSKKLKFQDELNLYNDFTWVVKVIKSCNTLEHIHAASNLIGILINKYQGKVTTSLLDLIRGELYRIYFAIDDVIRYKYEC